MYMIIRDAVAADLPEILEIYNDAIRRLTATFHVKEKSLEEQKEWFGHYGGRYPLIVAQVGDSIAGYTSLSVFRPMEAYQHTAELSLYVGEAFRNRGIGKILMKEIVNRAREHGFHTVISGITSGNEVSIRMHEEFQFAYIGNFRQVGWKFGEWQDVMFYQLLLE